MTAEWSAKMWPMGKRLLAEAAEQWKDDWRADFGPAVEMAEEATEVPAWPWFEDDDDDYYFLAWVYRGFPHEDWEEADKYQAQELIDAIDAVFEKKWPD